MLPGYHPYVPSPCARSWYAGYHPLASADTTRRSWFASSPPPVRLLHPAIPTATVTSTAAILALLYLLRPHLPWQVRQLSSATYDRYIQLQKGKRSLLRPLKLAYNGTLGRVLGVKLDVEEPVLVPINAARLVDDLLRVMGHEVRYTYRG